MKHVWYISVYIRYIPHMFAGLYTDIYQICLICTDICHACSQECIAALEPLNKKEEGEEQGEGDALKIQATPDPDHTHLNVDRKT